MTYWYTVALGPMARLRQVISYLTSMDLSLNLSDNLRDIALRPVYDSPWKENRTLTKLFLAQHRNVRV